MLLTKREKMLTALRRMRSHFNKDLARKYMYIFSDANQILNIDDNDRIPLNRVYNHLCSYVNANKELLSTPKKDLTVLRSKAPHTKEMSTLYVVDYPKWSSLCKSAIKYSIDAYEHIVRNKLHIKVKHNLHDNVPSYHGIIQENRYKRYVMKSQLRQIKYFPKNYHFITTYIKVTRNNWFDFIDWVEDPSQSESMIQTISENAIVHVIDSIYNDLESGIPSNV